MRKPCTRCAAQNTTSRRARTVCCTRPDCNRGSRAFESGESETPLARETRDRARLRLRLRLICSPLRRLVHVTQGHEAPSADVFELKPGAMRCVLEAKDREKNETQHE